MRTYDIFISYSNRNLQKVNEIVSVFNSFKVDYWFQKDNSRNDYLKEVNKGIKASKSFIVFLSDASINSIMVKNEIISAIRKFREDPSFIILPVVIEELGKDAEGEISLLLGCFNWLYAKDFDDYFALVLKMFSILKIELNSTGPQSIYTGDEESEIYRINLQNEYLNKVCKKYLDEIFAEYADASVLDVGCADGSNILRRLANRKYDSLLGIDRNSRKIMEACAKYGDGQHVFQVCDIRNEELEKVLITHLEKIGRTGFDVIHISSVLLHIEDVQLLLNKLYNYLSDKGTIFIQDEDDGANMVYPYEQSFEDCYYMYKHSNEAGDRAMGRKIPFYLEQAGFHEVKILQTSINSMEFGGKMKDRLWDLYFNSDLWVANSAEYYDDIRAYELLQNYMKRQPQLRADYMAGKYFVMLGIFFISAKK